MTDEVQETCGGMVPEGLHHDVADDDEVVMTEVDAMVQHGRAAAIAALAHRGQTDKIGDAYLGHPLRVAERFDRITQPVEHCAALLHDVVEDSAITLGDLAYAGILPEIVEIIALLTRDKSVDDAFYYARIRANPRALAVKLADIDDNSAGWRVEQLEHAVQERLAQKYRRARQSLAVSPLDEEWAEGPA